MPAQLGRHTLPPTCSWGSVALGGSPLLSIISVRLSGCSARSTCPAEQWPSCLRQVWQLASRLMGSCELVCPTSSYCTFFAVKSSLMRLMSCFSFKVVAVDVVYSTTFEPSPI